jgi:hypothetical protein
MHPKMDYTVEFSKAESASLRVEPRSRYVPNQCLKAELLVERVSQPALQPKSALQQCREIILAQDAPRDKRTWRYLGVEVAVESGQAVLKAAFQQDQDKSKL